jgi:hypothetical protein
VKYTTKFAQMLYLDRNSQPQSDNYLIIIVGILSEIQDYQRVAFHPDSGDQPLDGSDARCPMLAARNLRRIAASIAAANQPPQTARRPKFDSRECMR